MFSLYIKYSYVDVDVCGHPYMVEGSKYFIKDSDGVEDLLLWVVHMLKDREGFSIDDFEFSNLRTHFEFFENEKVVDSYLDQIKTDIALDYPNNQ